MIGKEEKWKCKCGSSLLVVTDPTPVRAWRCLRSEDTSIISWAFTNKKWWHYHDQPGEGFGKGFSPTEMV